MSKEKIVKTVKPDRPGGFLDYFPAQFLARERMINIITDVYRSFGFDPIETPMIEYLTTLNGETSDTGKNIFKIKSSSDDSSLGLRFDQTVPFARMLAGNPYLKKGKESKGIRLPWKRSVVGPVFRGEKPQEGRYRQFYQYDMDIAGTSSMTADAEVLAVMYETMKALGVERFVIKLNNRKILNGLAELVGIVDRKDASAEDITKEMMRILDKIDKIGLNGITKELKKNPENSYDPTPCLLDKAIAKITEYLNLEGNNRQLLNKAKSLFAGIKLAEEGIDELEQIVEYLDSFDVPTGFVQINFSIARGLDYYTGPVMETTLLDLPGFGSVLSGGRYDFLVKRFTGQVLPAVGASIGVDRLYAALDKLDLIDKSKKTPSEVMVLRLMKGKDSDYIKLASVFRNIGLNTEICFLDDTTWQSQFSFALDRGVKYIVIYGEDEEKNNVIQIKNFENRKQIEVSSLSLQNLNKSLLP